MTRLVIFDLDGTLLNTIEDLAAACNHALRGCGCPERKPEEYNMMVGRGIYNLFRAALPEGKKTDEMVRKMSERREKGSAAYLPVEKKEVRLIVKNRG